MSTPLEPDGGRPFFGPASPHEVDALFRIDADAPQAWTKEAFGLEFERDPLTLFVLRESGQPVAFVVFRIEVPEMDIVNLAVAPVARRRGLGRRLLSSLIDHVASTGIENVFLEVRESNLGGRRLYESAGFLEIQRRRGFYHSPPEDALVMRLQMSPLARLKGLRNAC